MLRVLVTGADNIGGTGLANAVFRWGQAFEHDRVVYDYLMITGMPDEEYRQMIASTGGKIFKAYGSGKLGAAYRIFSIFRENRDHILHLNVSSSYEAFPILLLARMAGMKKTAVHSHNSNIDSNHALIRHMKVFAHYFFRPYIVFRSGLKLACSTEAAAWMFGRRVVRNRAWEKVYNCADLKKYRYNPEYRNIHREELHIQADEVVLGSIGRLSYQKNYEYMIDVFAEFVKKCPKSRLLLIGEGGYRPLLQKKAAAGGLSERVIFAGSRKDANELLSAIDVFVLPSRFEGLPLVLIEAQAAQLPCVVSDSVTKECKMTKTFVYAKNGDTALWSDTIMKLAGTDRSSIEKISEGDYELKTAAGRLQKIYERYQQSVM